MRKVTKNIANAFINNRKLTQGNTMTDGQAIYLHGNRIAWKDENNDLWVSMCGWGSVTTRERLDGLFESIGSMLRIVQRDYAQYFIMLDDDDREANKRLIDTNKSYGVTSL